MRTRLGALAATTVGALLLTGCIQLPEAGPVVETDAQSGVEDDPAMSIDALPPRPDASPLEIADGFLTAMAAWPIQTNVAKEFLAEDAQASWDPRASTTTYLTADPLQEDGTTVTVELTEPELIDGRGAWQGTLPPGERVLDFDMVLEDGEFRIAEPPAGLVVPATWFAPRFRQVALYFFDRSLRILVPEPVFVPRGEQLVSTLVDGLLAGPPDEAIGRTALPPGLVLDLSSVPVSDDGVADISLSGEVGQLSPQTTERIMAQMAWTLRQEPSIRSVRLTIGEQELRPPDGDAEFRVGAGAEYDPTGFQSNPLLYGLSEGLLASGTDATLTPVSGPLGQQDFGLRAVAVNLSATTAAGISADGRSVLVASVAAEAGVEGPGSVDQVVSSATNLLPPAWDVNDRLWLVDRTAAGARVSYREGGRVGTLYIPGVSGRNVSAFLVSRDATRLVAVVRNGGVDGLRVARIQADATGSVLRAGPSEAIPLDDGRQLRVRDIAWTSTTTIAVLSPIVREVAEVLTVAVDGAPTGGGSLATTISGRVTGLAGTPVPEGVPFAVTPTGLIDLTTQAGQSFGAEVTSIDHVG